jgi:phosphonate transport system ATP-binding protein
MCSPGPCTASPSGERSALRCRNRSSARPPPPGAVGLADLAHRRADTLSGGQQQRAAIARTLLQGAGVILGDEPVSSLDPGSADRVLQAFARINREDGVTCILCLHQIDYARSLCPRTIALAGRVVFDGATSELTADLLGGIYAHPPDRFVPPAP